MRDRRKDDREWLWFLVAYVVLVGIVLWANS